MTGQQDRFKAASARAAGLALGLAADQLLGDPPNQYHPVAWFGTAVSKVEAKLFADDRAAGAKLVAVTALPLAAAGAVLDAATAKRPLARIVTTAAVTWVCVGMRSLMDEGRVLADRLASDDLSGARAQLSNLCGRDADHLDEPELARAAVESLAENTSDAVVGTLWWGSVAGLGGMLAHRAINTLDAMVGHRSERYENFGWAAAKIDDLANLVPARITAGLACLNAGNVGGQPVRAARVMLRDGGQHPSPNGGWCEAAFAGALGVQLGGHNVYYGGRVEDRGLLGDGPRPDAIGIRRATQLVESVSTSACALLGAAIGGLANRRSRQQ